MIKLTKYREFLNGEQSYIYVAPDQIVAFEDRWSDQNEMHYLCIWTTNSNCFIEVIEPIKYLLKEIRKAKE